ncbi:MAG: YbaB/EbfC family nucleoid-associated protein [bacterium]
MDMMKMLKEAYQLRSKYKDMQQELKQKKFTYEEHGITAVIDGSLELVDIKISQEAIALGSKQLEEIIKRCMCRVNSNAKEELAKEFKGLVNGGLM